MYAEQCDYVAYLLRLWRPNHGREPSNACGWHASLEHVETGERIGFGDLDELFGFLRDEVGRQVGSQTDSD